MEKFWAPGAPGGPGHLAPSPVEEESKSRAGPACLFTLHPSTPQEKPEVVPSNQAMSFQPCNKQFLCTVTQAGLPTATVVVSLGKRPDQVDQGTGISHGDTFGSGYKSNKLKSLYLQLKNSELSKAVIFFYFKRGFQIHTIKREKHD